MSTPEEKFWNDPSVVATFAGLEPPPYWRDFFSAIINPSQYKVLDIGCGGGRLTEMLVRMGFGVWACDTSEAMITITRGRLGDIYNPKYITDRIINRSMIQLPFGDDEFDFVISNGIYHNVSSKEQFESAIYETARVLRPGGTVCFNSFYKGIIDIDLRSNSSVSYNFFTSEDLNMILLPKEYILKIFRKAELSVNLDIKYYESGVLTGKRSVMRGIATKRSNCQAS